MENQAFVELSIIIIFTLIMCGIMRALRQPIMIGYLFSGILLSPNFLNLLHNSTGLTTFSEIGISFLLFMVGLGLNLRNIREVGKSGMLTGLLQITLTSLFYFGLGQIFGFDNLTSAYIAVGLSFSSTVVIMKLLTDKLSLESLPGKITVGILIIQDLVAMLLLMVVSATSRGGDLASVILQTLLKGLGVTTILILISLKILPYITKKVAKSQELLLLFSIGWCMAIASLFYLMNFSVEIGALLAGITLSFSPYRHEISSKMRPLRDFFILLFFVLLGSQIVFTDLASLILPILILSIFVLLINPLIVIFVMGRFGYTKKTAFQVGVNFSQVSEFSLILGALGMKVGHLTQDTLSLLAIVGLITITGSTYFISYSEKIYQLLQQRLSIFERKGHKIDRHRNFDHQEHEIILIGYAKMGTALVESFKKMDKKFFIIDYDPQIIQELTSQYIDCLYSDISNSETFDEINFQNTKMVISTAKDLDTNLLLISKIQKLNPETIIIVLSHQIDEALRLYEQGANYVIMPYHIGSHHTSSLIVEYNFDMEKFLIEKTNHINKLLIKKQLSHHKNY